MHQPISNNGNGHVQPNGHTASAKQLFFARQLSTKIRGLGVRRLEILAKKMFDKPLAALTNLEASCLLDTLRSIRDGRINLDSIL